MPKESLSAREIEVLALAWQCVDPQPKVDMVKLASLTGYTPGSASVTFGNIKRKLKNMAAGASEDSPPAKSRSGGRARATATSTPKKRGATAAPASASKRRTARQPASSASDGNNDDDDDDDFGLNGPKVKKEEPAFDDGFDLVEEDVPSRESYGFLDGIETFGGGGAAKGSGRNASNGYRTVQLEEDE